MPSTLSQDNSPSHSQRSGLRARSLISGIPATTLAFLGLLASTTPLKWQVPSLDENAPVVTASISAKTLQSPVVPSIKTALPASPLPTPRVKNTPVKITVKTVPVNVEYQAVKLLPASPSLPSPASAPQRTIRQPGNNIVINRLPPGHRIPVSSDGMPEFYKVVLEPKGKLTDLGLMLRKARANFGYDQQDIFTGEVPDGAYVIHCQQLNTPAIRAMCWRELQVSDDQWVQYRFPRAQLKDWWKIEQQVRANIG